MNWTIPLIVIELLLSPISLRSQWTQIGWPYNGGVCAIESVPNGAGGTNLVAGIVQQASEAHVSTNNGANWSTISSLAKVDIRCFAVLGKKIYAGGWDGQVFVSTATE